MNRAISNKLADRSIDEQILYQPDIDTEWKDMMIGGPASINYVGAVMAIASRKDFSFALDYNYTLIKYPNSFHTTLVQVANEMYRALFGAHTAMDQIQANMRQIPDLLKRALKLITQASTSMTKAMLPRTLSNIGQYANESTVVARASFDRFTYLQDLLGEIFSASTYTNTQNKLLAEKLQNETELTKNTTKELSEAINEETANYEAARQALEEARQEYHKAMMNVPGGEWNSYAWQVYASNRPAVTCSGGWFWRACRSLRDEQFNEYNAAAKWKAEQALQHLKEAEAESKKFFNNQVNKQNDMAAAIHQLASLNLAELSINQTIKVLLDAAQKISEVQTQWARITKFFSKLAVETGNTQKVIMENFLGVIADAETINKPLDPIDKMLYMTMLIEAATDIDRDSHLLFLMAKTYSDVSNEYMINQIAGISGFLTLQTNEEREAYLQSVSNKTETIASQIIQLAAQRQLKYEEVSFARQLEYEQFIEESEVHEITDLFGGIGVGKRR
ncbi:unnamed protein product [Rotaria sordida]|nr:unnamed protein product [Rotaria sordida]CAF1417568.1 unnamed protein product [Rotaria sordida]CAF3734408.1 unnamed protein product [Rotaria sordida]CAF3866374.1 unnamed protein product [Rotaria sordida]CAF4020913.1 unnamed protein product [Rotaria sordida]